MIVLLNTSLEVFGNCIGKKFVKINRNLSSTITLSTFECLSSQKSVK